MAFPHLLDVGPWSLHPHPVFELLGYSVGFQAYLWLRRRHGDAVGTMRLTLVLAAILGALVGAKLLALLEDPVRTWEGRTELQTWLEGKTIVGGLLGGWGAVELAKRSLGIASATADLYPVPLCIGIAVGRVGCFLTGLPDRTYGTATGLPWGVDFGDGIPRHPTQLYEIAALALLAFAIVRHGSRLAPGGAWRLFVAGYLGWRVLVGFIQPGPTLAGLQAIQWASLAGAALAAWQLRPLLPRPRTGPAPTEAPA